MNAITREDLLSFRASMPPHARGVKAVDALIARLTHEQLERDVALMRQSDGLGAWLADALEAEMDCFDAEAAA